MMPHHVQQELCRTRPLYRQGRKLTAVKVYTVNDESVHLIVCGVPKINLGEEIKKLFAPYGDIKTCELLVEYPCEEFTESFHVQFERIQSARIAKRLVDNKNFFGGILHVCYAPELESLAETRRKLIQRQKDIIFRIKRHRDDPTNVEKDEFIPKAQYHRQKKYPTLPLTEERLSHQYPNESFTSINDGIPKSIDPRPVSEPSLPPSKRLKHNKHVNYKGHVVRANNKLVRPKIIDTKSLPHFKALREDAKVVPVVKKVDSGIKIKLLSHPDPNKKRIIIKNPGATKLINASEELQASINSVKSSIRKAMQRNESSSIQK
ncbi:RNA-binding protein 48 [Fopius arisanus]|uniref:RNA-binding protein 48 n=1 Tax=Fopius arisanus TaxID=64838 RepID=A0A9R1U814_9HYME|nr:PREDICTED: RNA-binding protein 48 [Fopius arisanus]